MKSDLDYREVETIDLNNIDSDSLIRLHNQVRSISSKYDGVLKITSAYIVVTTIFLITVIYGLFTRHCDLTSRFAIYIMVLVTSQLLALVLYTIFSTINNNRMKIWKVSADRLDNEILKRQTLSFMK